MSTLSPKEEQILLRLARKKLAERSLYQFLVNIAWPILEPSTPFVDNWHIRAICSHLEAFARREIENLLIQVPPGSSKSTICAVCFPAWLWCTKPSTRLITASYKTSLALRDSVRSRDLMDSEAYFKNWPLKFKDRQDNKSHFANNKTGNRITLSTKVGSTGERCDFSILDDAEDITEAESLLERQKVKQWYDHNLYDRINPGGGHLVIGHRVHDDDLIGYLMKKGTYESLLLPEEFDPPRKCKTSIFTDPRTEPGELLWPGLYTEEKIAAQRANGDWIYWCKYQLDPKQKAGNLFKAAGFPPTIPVVDALPEGLDYIRYWDLASSAAGSRGDFTAGVLMGRPKARQGRLFYIVHVCRGQWQTDERNARMLAQAKLDRASGRNVKIVIERVGSAGKDIIQEFARLFESFRMEEDVATRDKEFRIDPFATAVNNGLVRLYREDVNDPWHDKFVAECLAFPHARHDDQPDAAAGAYNLLANTSGMSNDELLEAMREVREEQEKQLCPF